MRDSIIELGQLLRARIDCIWIESYEEEEVLNDIKELLQNDRHFSGYALQLWSRTEGLTHMALSKFEKQAPPNSKIREFPALFGMIKHEQQKTDDYQGTKNIWVLRDMHTVITDPKCQRFIRDLKEYSSDNYNPIVVIAPSIELPDDVSRLFRVVEYGLPTEEMVRSYVERANLTLKRAAESHPDGDFQPATEEEMVPLTRACMGLTTKEADMALRESMVKFKKLDLDFLSRSKIQIVKKTGVLDYKIPSISLDDIGGNQAIKDWLVETTEAFSDEAQLFGLTKPKGYMAVGIAGCGKTAMAEAFAKTMQVPLLELSMDKIMDKLVGQSERKIAHALAVAKACAPCVLLLDEVEKMLGAAALSSNASDGGVTARILQALLKFMNDNDSGVYVIMTSNDVSQLPPEFTRSGRLDATWYFGLPDPDERKGIFKIHFAHKNRDVSDVLLDEAVSVSNGFTGAEIKQVVENTMRKAFVRFKEDGNKNITVDDIEAAAAEVIPISQSSREKITALENYCKTRARSTSYDRQENRQRNADSASNDDEPNFLLDDF